MENLLYGFEVNISNYDLKYVFLWILLMSILNVIVGSYIEKRKMSHIYFKLIRLRRFSKWWYKLCGSILLLSTVLMILLFGIVILCQYVLYPEGFEKIVLIKIVKAFFVFLMSFITMNMFQIWLINSANGEKFSFLIVTVIEVISLYFGLISEQIAPWLPGSFMMYYRSDFFIGTGFNVAALFIIQFAFDIILFFSGYKIMMRRK